MTKFSTFNTRTKPPSPCWSEMDITWPEKYTVQCSIYMMFTQRIIVCCRVWNKRSTVLLFHYGHERFHIAKCYDIWRIYTVHSTIYC
jgi:hypothetical protein